MSKGFLLINLEHSKHKFTTVTSIFRVYIILLEYTCKTDYKMILSALTKGHQDEINEIKLENIKAIEELNKNMEEVVKFQKNTQEEKNKRMKLEEEVIGKF